MPRDILYGTLAGAAGTVALYIVTYIDMAIRGRPSSEVPAKVAEKVAAGAGIDFGGHNGSGQQSQAQSEQSQETAQQRASGLGALLGYATGLGVEQLTVCCDSAFGASLFRSLGSCLARPRWRPATCPRSSSR